MGITGDNRTKRHDDGQEADWMELRMGSVLSVFFVMALTLIWLGLSLALCRLYEKCCENPCMRREERGIKLPKVFKSRSKATTCNNTSERPQLHSRTEIVGD